MRNGDRRDEHPIINEVDERDSVSYEEFGGTQDYVNCPTCQGTGRVSRKRFFNLEIGIFGKHFNLPYGNFT